MRKLSLLGALILSPLALWGQSFSDIYNEASNLLSGPFFDPNTGLTAFPSLLIPSGGLYEGMGTAFTAVASDASYIEANPAASATLVKSELSVLHNSWIADSSLESVEYTNRYKDLGYGFAGKFLYLPFTAYDEWGDQVSKGYYSEAIATVNVSYNFFSSYYFYGLALGANIKGAYRNVPSSIYPGQSAGTAMIDLGALTRFNLFKTYASTDKNFSVGAAVKNLGFYVEGEPLPTEASFGLAYKPIRPLLVSTDFNYPFSLEPSLYPAELWNIATGMDLSLTDFFAVQSGFSYAGDDPRITIGSTVALKTMTLDLNYTLDLATQFGTDERFSVAANINLGDSGRAEIEREVEDYYAEGLEAYAKGNYASALSFWEQALKLDPTFQPAAQYEQTVKTAMGLEKAMENVRKVE